MPMIHVFKSFGCAFALMLVLATSVHADLGEVTVGKRPDWVTVQEWDESVRTPSLGDGNESVVYLWTDLQYRPKAGEKYRKRVYRVINDAGVQQNLKVTIDFDPGYSELILHDISIRRGEDTINKLDLEKTKVFQPEDELSSDVYSENKRCLVFLEDLRVDDVVVVEYTIKGLNPAMLGQFSCRLPIQFSVPVEHSFLRVLWESSEPIFHHVRNSELQPEVTEQNGRTELVWSIPPQPIAYYEDSEPDDFVENPYIEVTSTGKWADVVAWGLKTYEHVDAPLDAATREILDGWKNEYPEDEQYALKALRFVQNKIRYVGLEMGPQGLCPSHPCKTMEYRFGDCKGKSALLCAILRYAGIKAWPALVNTYRKGDIQNSKPTLMAFNHVIATVELDGKTVWVDPTYSQQGGAFADSYVPAYGKALVIREGEQTLQDVVSPENSIDYKNVEATFELESYDKAATMQVVTEFHGRAADSMRRFLVDTDYKSLSEDYLNYYAETYPGIRDPTPIKINDDLVANKIRVEQNYLVDDLFVEFEEGEPRQAEFYPFGLTRILRTPDTRIRKSPLAIYHPARRKYKTTLITPTPLGYDDNDLEVKNLAFELSALQRFSGTKAEFIYSLDTLRDRIPAEDVAEYLEACENADDSLGDFPDEPISFEQDINWLAITLALIATVVSSVMVFLLLSAGRFRGSGVAGNGCESIGGWLILVGLGVFLTPINPLIILFGYTESYFVWSTWFDWESSLILTFEIIANSVTFVFGVGLIFAFVRKRKLLPYCFVGFRVWLILVALLDHGLVMWLWEEMASQEDVKVFFKLVVNSMIWCPYMLLSKRVKGTFVH